MRVVIKYRQEAPEYRVRGVDYRGNDHPITLGGVDGYMYISVPEETVNSYIPQPDSVDIDTVTITPTLCAELSKTGEVAGIDHRTRAAIRSKYSVEDELKALRTDDFEYKQFVEGIVEAGKEEKGKILGLIQYDTSGKDIVHPPPSGPVHI